MFRLMILWISEKIRMFGKAGVSLRTFSLLKGMPVYNHQRDLLGEICDICITDDGRVSDILLHKKGLFGKKFRIPIEFVHSFGEQEVVIADEQHITKWYEREGMYTMHHCNPISKKSTSSQTGEHLGLLDDVYFLEEVGTIVGYELTDGFFSDITKGKRVIRTPHPPKIGKDSMIVSVTKLRGGEAHDEMSELP